MNCPKCNHTMVAVPAPKGLAVERCDRCGGLLCSDAALAGLERHWFLWPTSSIDDIDTGKPSDGRRWNTMRRIACPSCGSPMTAENAADQTHIELERCASCQLTFFDAGEMTDLRYKTFADWIRDRLHAAHGREPAR